jgi:predicted glycosyltransferase
MANYVAEGQSLVVSERDEAGLPRRQNHAIPRKKIWIDLDNTPHVPFFKPILPELEKAGYDVVLTARDAFQVCELAKKSRLNYIKIGHHYGKNSLLKLWGIVFRALQLLPLALRHRPALALSHGARSQILLCNLLRIPSVLIMDYEHAKPFPLSHPTWEIIPDALANEKLLCPKERIRTYHGIKEDVYAADLVPDSSILQQLGLTNGDVIVTIRPPATEAHYHNPESDALFKSFMDRLCRAPNVSGVLLPRNHSQEEYLRRHWPHWFKDSRVVVPKTVVDGLNILWHSDLVVSGGGTMNREAAALGVPVYSIFRGKIGAVDRCLQREGRLVLIESVEDVHSKIALKRRRKDLVPDKSSRRALQEIIQHINEIMEIQHPSCS